MLSSRRSADRRKSAGSNNNSRNYFNSSNTSGSIHNGSTYETTRRARRRRRRRTSGTSEELMVSVATGAGGREGRKRREFSTTFTYRVNDGTGHGGSLLHQVFRERGWREFNEGKKRDSSLDPLRSEEEEDDEDEEEEEETRREGNWNLWWRNGSLKSTALNQLRPTQLTNHIPKATGFCRKDVLARYLRRMRRTYGPVYDFSPLSFNLPLEYRRLCSEHSRRRRVLEAQTARGIVDGSNGNNDTNNNKANIGHLSWLDLSSCSPYSPSPVVWICKPVGRSQGRGIRVFDEVAEIAYDSSSVVQEYITRPFLIGGYKWDLRIYVCIASIRPLRIYAYREGLARFATNKYNLNSLRDPFAHLTNVSLNKQNPAYKLNKEQIGQGSKWSLGRLRRHFYERGVCDWFLWQRIMSILVLTILGEAHTLTHLDVKGENCFEFLGFDILVTEDLEPRLLEVNTNPSLGSDCAVDEMVKRPMLHELLSLLGLPDEREEEQQQHAEEAEDQRTTVKLKENIPNSCCHGNRILSRQTVVGDQLRGKFAAENEEDGKSGRAARTGAGPLLLRQSSWHSFNHYSSTSALNPPTPDRRGMKEEGRRMDQGCHGRASYGDWLRIFPFDVYTGGTCGASTGRDTLTMSVHDVKIGISRMQSYLKIAQRIASGSNSTTGCSDLKSNSSDIGGQKPPNPITLEYRKDQMAKEYGKLLGDPWHPRLKIN